MADLPSAEASNQFASSLHVVRREIEHALDHAAVQLDNYSSDGSEETIRAFLEEIRQLRGTFKMLDFRAGERLCEELTETIRRSLKSGVTPQTGSAVCVCQPYGSVSSRAADAAVGFVGSYSWLR